MSHTEIGILVNAEDCVDAESQADRQMGNMLNDIGVYYDLEVIRTFRADTPEFREELRRIVTARRNFLRTRLRRLRQGDASPKDRRRWRADAIHCVSGDLIFGDTYYFSTLAYDGCITNRDMRAVKDDPKRHWLVFFDYHN